jgi:hypothetical protein
MSQMKRNWAERHGGGWSADQQMAFVNALREALGFDPLPMTREAKMKKLRAYSGLPIYGLESGQYHPNSRHYLDVLR